MMASARANASVRADVRDVRDVRDVEQGKLDLKRFRWMKFPERVWEKDEETGLWGSREVRGSDVERRREMVDSTNLPYSAMDNKGREFQVLGGRRYSMTMRAPEADEVELEV